MPFAIRLLARLLTASVLLVGCNGDTPTPATPSPSTPAPAPESDDAQAIRAYLSEHHSSEPWFEAIDEILVEDGMATIHTGYTPDGRGRALAASACEAVAANDRIELTEVVVTAAGGVEAASCRP